MKDWKDVRLDELEMNTGQLAWLPRNPRQWTQDQLDRLKESIRETPLLLEARGLIVWKGGKRGYVVVGGNMRLAALRELGAETAPCYVLPEDLSPEKVKEILEAKDRQQAGAARPSAEADLPPERCTAPRETQALRISSSALCRNQTAK